MYETIMAAVRVRQELGDWFKQKEGTKQEDPVLPITFIAYLKRVMDVGENKREGVKVNGEMVSNLRSADDIDLLEEEVKNLRCN